MNKQFVEESEYDSLFDELWSRTKRRFVKFETLQTYHEEGEQELLNLFRTRCLEELHSILIDDVEDERSIWRDAKKRHLTFHRIHVYDLPLSEYLRFELEAYKIQAEAGEIISMISRDRSRQEGLDELTDFMLFDDSELLIPQYDSTNRLIGALYSNVEEDIAPLKWAYEVVLASGTPLSDFLRDVAS